jgi:PAS domain S-box-containing protein
MESNGPGTAGGCPPEAAPLGGVQASGRQVSLRGSGEREAPRSAEQEFRTLADNIPYLVARFDRELRHVYVNPQVERLTGLPASEYLGKTNRQMAAAPEDILVAGEERLRHVLQTGSETALEFTLGDRSFHAWFGPEFGATGRIETLLCITRDVTEQKRLEAELRRRMEELAHADRRKDEFLATLAHELRNPLAPLRNGLELLRRGGDDPALGTRTRQMMERQLGHLVRLVDDLLDLARVTQGKLQVRLQAVDLVSVVESAVETARPLLEERRHRLQVTLPEAQVLLHADLTRLAQVLGNLLTNAAKYTDPGGHVSVTAECRGQLVVIRVEDDGIGIPAQELPRLFRIFSQVTPALERTQGGVGIGLALAKALVELHGGTVSAESRGPGQGSTFSIELPLAQPGEVLDAPRVEPSRSAARVGVLVVDDNVDGADSVSALLERAGAEVRTCYEGRRALELAASFRPEVMILDLGMPGMNGYEVARAVRAAPWGSEVYLVAMTGWGQDEDRRRTREAGFDAHLVKPPQGSELLGLLERRPASPR